MSEPRNATWSQDAYPAVPPDAKFRQDLQRALEQTHRQQAAQRKRRPHKGARRQLTPQRVAGVALLLLALLMALRWLRRGRSARRWPASPAP